MAHSEDLYIDYGTTRIPFLLQYKNRKTLSISVTPDKKVAIIAPIGASLQKIMEKAGRKAAWISKQVRKFEWYTDKLPHRNVEYISGETFYYRGRKYRLKVLEGEEEGVNLLGKYLRVTVQKKSDEKHVADLLMDWYRLQAKEIFNERFERSMYILKREKISVNRIMVRRLETRWGSCTQNGNIILNLSLVQAPVQCIDYVLIHELCHLKYLNHGKKFYSLLERYVDNWDKKQKRLLLVQLL